MYSRKFTQRGEVWLVDLGENIGSEQNGIRPCIVLQRQRKKENTCIVLPASRTNRFSTITVGRYSFVMHQIRVVDTTRFIKEFERLEKDMVDNLCDKFSEFIKK